MMSLYWKRVHIIKADLYPDHVHMLVEILPKMIVAGLKVFLKGKNSIIIYQKWKILNTNIKIDCFGALDDIM